MSGFSIYLALAEASAKAPEAHDQQLLDVDGTLFLNFGLFLLTMFLLTRLLWRPYLRVRELRVGRIEGYKEEARRLEVEAAARLAKVEAELAEARRLGSAERSRVRAEAQKREQQILAAAQARAQQTLAESRARVEAALGAERTSLAARAEALGRDAAEKVLGRSVAS
jgi:F0F1-type ATP synthase membrane subunit b/b'